MKQEVKKSEAGITEAANKTKKPLSTVAVIGRTMLIPAILPVKILDPPVECLVKHSVHSKITDETRGMDLDVSDCTIFNVTHLSEDANELNELTNEKSSDVIKLLDKLLEQSLQAISEVIIWSKTLEKVGETSPFTRQIGRLDVKFFLHPTIDGHLYGFANPLFKSNSPLTGGMLFNMVMVNGPSSNPVHSIIRRIMSTIDLINLGFYSESFVNLFALVDDLVQEVMKKGLELKGLDTKAQKEMLRAIKEERLKHFLNNISVICGWVSLKSHDQSLYEKLMKVNQLRNNIMHGSTRISRTEVLEACDQLLFLIDWLRSNPFNYFIPHFPLMKLAEAKYDLINKLNQ